MYMMEHSVTFMKVGRLPFLQTPYKAVLTQQRENSKVCNLPSAIYAVYGPPVECSYIVLVFPVYV